MEGGDACCAASGAPSAPVSGAPSAPVSEAPAAPVSEAPPAPAVLPPSNPAGGPSSEPPKEQAVYMHPVLGPFPVSLGPSNCTCSLLTHRGTRVNWDVTETQLNVAVQAAVDAGTWHRTPADLISPVDPKVPLTDRIVFRRLQLLRAMAVENANNMSRGLGLFVADVVAGWGNSVVDDVHRKFLDGLDGTNIGCYNKLVVLPFHKSMYLACDGKEKEPPLDPSLLKLWGFVEPARIGLHTERYLQTLLQFMSERRATPRTTLLRRAPAIVNKLLIAVVPRPCAALVRDAFLSFWARDLSSNSLLLLRSDPALRLFQLFILELCNLPTPAASGVPILPLDGGGWRVAIERDEGIIHRTSWKALAQVDLDLLRQKLTFLHRLFAFDFVGAEERELFTKLIRSNCTTVIDSEFRNLRHSTLMLSVQSMMDTANLPEFLDGLGARAISILNSIPKTLLPEYSASAPLLVTKPVMAEVHRMYEPLDLAVSMARPSSPKHFHGITGSVRVGKFRVLILINRADRNAARGRPKLPKTKPGKGRKRLGWSDWLRVNGRVVPVSEKAGELLGRKVLRKVKAEELKDIILKEEGELNRASCLSHYSLQLTHPPQ